MKIIVVVDNDNPEDMMAFKTSTSFTKWKKEIIKEFKETMDMSARDAAYEISEKYTAQKITLK